MESDEKPIINLTMYNSIEIVVYYLLIEGMTCLGHRDKFPMVNALVCTNTLYMTYSESWHKVISCHDSSSYSITWALNLEMILSLCWNQ